MAFKLPVAMQKLGDVPIPGSFKDFQLYVKKNGGKWNGVKYPRKKREKNNLQANH